MTDQTPADQVQEIAAAMRASMRRVEDDYPDGEFLMDMSNYIRDLENLHPDPPLPTLADMSIEERRACKWMQCEVSDVSRRRILLNPYNEDGDVEVFSKAGWAECFSPDRVTPLPNLPRMMWPDGAPVPENTLAEGSVWDDVDAPAPALPDGWRLADHPEYGRVVVTRPEPDDDGEAAIIVSVPTDTDRSHLEWCNPDELTFLDNDREGDQ